MSSAPILSPLVSGTVLCVAENTPAAEETVLAFDIETTGVDAARHIVTCVCVVGMLQAKPYKRTFLFGRDGVADSKELFSLFDAADVLYAYNGVRFDIPFLAQRFNVNTERVSSWICKLFDVFEVCKLCVNRTFSLNALLAVNCCDGECIVFCYVDNL